MTSPVTQITDFIKRQQEDKLGQFWGDEVTDQWIAAIATETQRLEDLIFEMATNTLLDNATGEILDWLGGIARVSRLGRTDDDYRKIIQVAIAARDSDGGADDIVWIASQLFDADVRYIQEGGLPWFRLEYYSDDALSDELLAEALFLIGIAVPPGVAWRVQATYATGGAQYDVDTYGAGTYGDVIGTS